MITETAGRNDLIIEINSFTPFFLADRQASLRILSGLTIPDGKHIGLMTHSNTTDDFKNVFKVFPCVNPISCDVMGGLTCPFDGDMSKCTKGKKFKNSIITICDSGVFTKEGCALPRYNTLFNEYENLNVDYGIIIDVLKDKEETLSSARRAMRSYRRKKRSFKLMGVAQGNYLEEYVECYKKLRRMGFEYIAIGGMLQKKENSARYVRVRNEKLLQEVLESIRGFDTEGHLFALGCYSPKRHRFFTRYSVFGSDYKGWIFHYKGKSPRKGNKRAQKSRFHQVREFIAENVIARSQEWNNEDKLLIIPCSKTKISRKGLASAINVYNGPLYNLIRKYVSDFTNTNGFDIMILSAKYGLIEPTKKIRVYDQLMTKKRAQELKADVSRDLENLFAVKHYSTVLVNLGKTYFEAVKPALDGLQDQTEIEILSGRIGERLKKTKEWILSNN